MTERPRHLNDYRRQVLIRELRQGEMFWTCLTGKRGLVLHREHMGAVIAVLAGKMLTLSPSIRVLCRRLPA